MEKVEEDIIAFPLCTWYNCFISAEKGTFNVWRENFMKNSINKKEYFCFLKSAYKRSNIIYADFDEKIESVEALQEGKFSDIYNDIIDTSIEQNENRIPYTRLKLRKSYAVYDYLQRIDNWEEFSEIDPVTELAIWAIYFYSDDLCIGVILSHYRAYDNCFYLCDS